MREVRNRQREDAQTAYGDDAQPEAGARRQPQEAHAAACPGLSTVIQTLSPEAGAPRLAGFDDGLAGHLRADQDTAFGVGRRVARVYPHAEETGHRIEQG